MLTRSSTPTLFTQGQEALGDFRLSTLLTNAKTEFVPTRVAPLWQKPSAGKVKTNWDAAIDVQHKCMGVGVIIHDDVGAVVAAMCSKVPYITDPALAEAIALWKAVSLCLELNIQRYTLKGMQRR
jgi:signal transduction histidine kinase